MRARGSHICLLVALFSLLGANASHAQQTGNQQWFSVGVSQNIKDFKWSVDQNLRLRYGFSIVAQSFTEVGLKYKFSKYFSLATKYRTGWKDNVETYYYFNRFSIDPLFRHKIKKADLKFTYRPRFQFAISNLQGRSYKWYFRNKLEIEKSFDKTSIWTAVELFMEIGPQARVSGFHIDQYRLFLGVSRDFGKRHSVKLYYFLSQEINEADPLRRHIVALGYNYQLKKLKLKKFQNRSEED